MKWIKIKDQLIDLEEISRIRPNADNSEDNDIKFYPKRDYDDSFYIEFDSEKEFKETLALLEQTIKPLEVEPIGVPGV
jgi:hypothetical protein